MDIGLFLSADGSGADLAIANGDIALDSTLQTAVILSLMCDRLADADDAIPDGSSYRRGWCGDPYLPPLPDGSPDYLGSKLYLFLRCTATQQNANLIAGAAYDSLEWMILDGIASSIVVTTSWIDSNGLAMNVVITRAVPGSTAPTAYAFLWDRTLGTLTPVTSLN
jgi:phage gp46-like protein